MDPIINIFMVWLSCVICIVGHFNGAGLPKIKNIQLQNSLITQDWCFGDIIFCLLFEIMAVVQKTVLMGKLGSSISF